MKLKELFDVEICKNHISLSFAKDNPGAVPYGPFHKSHPDADRRNGGSNDRFGRKNDRERLQLSWRMRYTDSKETGKRAGGAKCVPALLWEIKASRRFFSL